MHISMRSQSKRIHENPPWEGICTMIAVHSELAITWSSQAPSVRTHSQPLFRAGDVQKLFMRENVRRSWQRVSEHQLYHTAWHANLNSEGRQKVCVVVWESFENYRGLHHGVMKEEGPELRNAQGNPEAWRSTRLDNIVVLVISWPCGRCFIRCDASAHSLFENFFLASYFLRGCAFQVLVHQPPSLTTI